MFYDAIKTKYPGVTTIADTTSNMQGQPVEFVDNHFYRDPNAFFQMANHYDNADRSGPQIYVGEYAINRDVGRGNLLGALSEAVFMLDMERNSDVVKMASYAPLFENVNKPDWRVNLILFDSSRVVGRSSYQVQKLFSANRPDVVLPTMVEAPATTVGTNNVHQIYALAGLDRRQNEVILKVVNPTPADAVVTVQLRGASKIGNQARLITLGNSDANAENKLDAPNAVVPVEHQMKLQGAKFSATFAPNSLSILRVPVNLN
jgi:alpha-N-arabinofuranosidase